MATISGYNYFHMPRTHPKPKKTLAEQYPPSEPCSCPVCLSFCIRPGWWTVAEAAGRAFNAGYGERMMLEFSPERSFGVLSPAFLGNEGAYALNNYKDRGCNFLTDQRCELHGTGFQPLECRFCHHDRPGQGPICHADLEKDWNTPAGQGLVEKWLKWRKANKR
jgi:hypothetical protein